jgi:hypothetical protein
MNHYPTVSFSPSQQPKHCSFWCVVVTSSSSLLKYEENKAQVKNKNLQTWDHVIKNSIVGSKGKVFNEKNMLHDATAVDASRCQKRSVGISARNFRVAENVLTHDIPSEK